MQFVRYKKLADEEVPTGKAYLGTFVETFPNSIGFVHVYKATQIAELYGKVQEGRYGFYIREIKKMYPRMGLDDKIEVIKRDKELTQLKKQVKEIKENSEDIK